MTRRIRQVGVGTLAIALGTGAALYAATQNTAGGPGLFMGHRPPFARLLRPGDAARPLRMRASRLGLTDEQKAQMKAVAQAHRDQWRALAERAVTARQALRQAVTADAIDEAAIRLRSADVAAAEADIAIARAHARAEMFKVLTPEQQEKAKALRYRNR